MNINNPQWTTTQIRTKCGFQTMIINENHMKLEWVVYWKKLKSTITDEESELTWVSVWSMVWRLIRENWRTYAFFYSSWNCYYIFRFLFPNMSLGFPVLSNVTTLGVYVWKYHNIFVFILFICHWIKQKDIGLWHSPY